MKISKLLLLVSVFLAAFLSFGLKPAFAGRFDFLDRYDSAYRSARSRITPEISETPVVRAEARKTNLRAFYSDFEADGEVTFFIGYGYEFYFDGRDGALYDMLRSLAYYYGLDTGNWQFTGNTIRFTDLKRNIRYRITIGTERDEYMAALASSEVILYHGHSRYGIGPAFGGFSNYFRMGRDFKTIEVDTRNPYFRKEPLQLTGQYPPYEVYLGGTDYLYQYRGQRTFMSYLPDSSYTKNVPGLDADLRASSFAPGRQLFYFYSCKNRQYWEESFRARFPDADQKFVFGTDNDSYGATKPDALMIMSVVRRVSSSDAILQDLNATGDCQHCFTAY